MQKFLDVLDGTGRPLFPVQRDFLAWLQEQKSKVIAGQLPPGTGKSLIVRTIQRATGASVITPSNLLVSQYSGIYPSVNVLKGQQHYQCKEHCMSCSEVKELRMKPCEGCTYRACRRAALEGEPTFYNPISLWNLAQDEEFERPSVTVVDEAHQLLSMLLLVAGESFSADKFRLPESLHAGDILEWLKDQLGKATRVSESAAAKQQELKAVRALRDSQRLMRVTEFLESDPANYVITLGEDRQRDGATLRALQIKPLLPPRPLIDSVLGTGKRIFLSGTLTRLDAQLLAPGEEITYIDMPSPIPASQRQVLYRPWSFESPRSLVSKCEELHREFGGPTIVHVTYAVSEALSKFAVSHLRNTSENKEEVVKRFKAEGGLFFAAGCAEGLDLPDGQCRLNIVPVLPRPNVGDSAVKKWLAQPGGSKRYDLETLRTFQQQIGRSTRHVNDWSVSVCLDPRLPELVRRNKQDISNSFCESIVWTGKKRG